VVCRKGPHTVWQRECIAAQRAILLHYLAQHGGNRTRAAAALGITRSNFFRLLRALEIPRARG
jgi:DNA-binding NtrC family response regulator